MFLIVNTSETIQNSLLRTGSFEPLAAQIAQHVVRRLPGLVLDVGANIGTFAVLLARLEPSQETYCFEPQPLVFYQLCANLLINRASNVRAMNWAVGRRPGRVRVPRHDPYIERFVGSVSLDEGVIRIRQTIPGVAEPALRAREFDEVELVTLDRFAEGRTVAFMKVDVEGMELEVLEGARQLISRCRPVIFSEAWRLPQFESRRLALLSSFRDLGYEIKQFADDFVAVPIERKNILPLT
jgi:FkbM family methyltransferase